MIDNAGRTIDYVRLSVTDACNLRCSYCMPEKGQCLPNDSGLLTIEQVEILCRSFASLGIEKIKITGGEPLVRKDIIPMIQRIKGIDGIRYISVTTNGVLLAEKAEALKQAGVDGINISLDAADPAAYRQVTRADEFQRVMAGIREALRVGIPTIKINCVTMKGLNENQLIPIAEMARHDAIHVRFIEMMPIGLGKSFLCMTQQEVAQKLADHYGELIPCAERLGQGPASYHSLEGFKGKIGFISAVSHKFCSQCNRVRVTSAGFLKTCLHYDIGADLRPLLEGAGTEKTLRETIREAIGNKPASHTFETQTKADCVDTRTMSEIGG